MPERAVAPERAGRNTDGGWGTSGAGGGGLEGGAEPWSGPEAADYFLASWASFFLRPSAYCRDCSRMSSTFSPLILSPAIL